MSLEPGIYFGLPEAEYHAAEGLSCSGMKQLAVSPLNYWHLHFNPDYAPPEESYPQKIGRAAHCRLLEPSAFRDRYATALYKEDYPGALVTAEDMKAWLAERGLPVTAKRKQELVDRIKGTGEAVILWDELCARYEEEHKGKTLLAKEDAKSLEGMASTVEMDPCASGALSGGVAEVSFFVREPETGVLLKARMDYVKPQATVDLKTFSNARGKPVERVVFDAIYYEGYYLQFAFYRMVRSLARQALASGEIATHGLVSEAWRDGFLKQQNHGFGFVFVESSAPFHLSVIRMKKSEGEGGEPNVYHSSATMKIEDSVRLYAECLERYGRDKPWREPCRPRDLQDTDMPQLMFT